jgi:hypothetical protein
MQLSTRLHDADDGRIVGNVSALSFGSAVPGTKSTMLVLSLHVGEVESISNIRFEVLPSQYADLDGGALQWSKALIFERKESLEASFASDRRAVSLRNLDDTTSELLYLQIDTSLSGFETTGNLMFRWSFDYVDSSSSSSSSSSNNYGDCPLIVAGQVAEITLGDDECQCYRLTIDSTEYATMMLSGAPVEIANVGDTLEIAGTPLLETEYVGVSSGGDFYSFYLFYGSDHEFVIEVCKLVFPNVIFELETLTNSSSSSSGSFSGSSSSSCSTSSP